MYVAPILEKGPLLQRQAPSRRCSSRPLRSSVGNISGWGALDAVWPQCQHEIRIRTDLRTNKRMSDNQDRRATRRGGDFEERWGAADPNERKYMLEDAGRRLMDEYEAPPPPIYPERFDDDRLMGQYRDEDFRIDMNEDLLENSDPHGAVDTYLHEYRHAWQNYEVQKSHGAMARETDQAEARAMESSLDEYVDPSVDEARYREQLAERDARDFASEHSDEVLTADDPEEHRMICSRPTRRSRFVQTPAGIAPAAHTTTFGWGRSSSAQWAATAEAPCRNGLLAVPGYRCQERRHAL